MAFLSEKEIIAGIRRQQGGVGSAELLVGIGDDCAVIRRGNALVELITTDTLVEMVHFDPAWHGPELLGRKAAAVNLSDVAAMGGRPRYAMLSLALPGDFSETWFALFMRGFQAGLAEHETLLIGGDTVKSAGGAVISVTVLGEAAEQEVLLRSTARPGDLVMVSGALGDAAAGLEICRRGKPGGENPAWRQLTAAHLDPVPEIPLGRVLAESGLVNAMMDISDGLATDLAHLCRESEVAAEIDKESLPMSEAMRDAARTLACDPVSWAIGGGEDYRLLFTVPAGQGEELSTEVQNKLGRKITVIGRIVEGEGVTLLDGGQRLDITDRGYDHFAEND
jgi:thiamine-monophosphate kinase